MKNLIQVAIDSPAAAGAGTQAKLIAKHYKLFYLDTGKIYRFIGKIKIKHKNKLDNGKIVDEKLFKTYLQEELLNVKNELGIEIFENGKFDLAKSIFEQITLTENVEEFLTTKAYEEL